MRLLRRPRRPRNQGALALVPPLSEGMRQEAEPTKDPNIMSLPDLEPFPEMLWVRTVREYEATDIWAIPIVD